MEFCKVESSNHILTVTINRPERLNALHPPGNAELGEVFDDFASNDDLWVAIITGAGRGFSAGNDLRHQAEGGERVPTPRGFGGLSSRWDLTKPVIAAVNGIAAGIGLSIAMSADVRIAAKSAQFSCIFVKRSLVPDGGASLMLQQLLGKGIAMEMSLTGNIYDSGWALDKGLVNKLTQNTLLLESALEVGFTIANNPPAAVRAIKRIMNTTESLLSGVIESENEANNLLLKTDDFQESILSFKEKRPPAYRDT